MKRARAGADGDSDAEDPGVPPETEGAGQPEEEEDEAEYFRQAVGEEPDEGMWLGSPRLGTLGLSLCCGGLDAVFFPQTCSQRQPNEDGLLGPQAGSSKGRSGGLVKALTPGLQRPRAAGPSGARPSWDAEELPGTAGEAKHGHLRKRSEARPERRMECPKLGPTRLLPRAGVALAFLS